MVFSFFPSEVNEKKESQSIVITATNSNNNTGINKSNELTVDVSTSNRINDDSSVDNEIESAISLIDVVSVAKLFCRDRRYGMVKW